MLPILSSLVFAVAGADPQTAALYCALGHEEFRVREGAQELLCRRPVLLIHDPVLESFLASPSQEVRRRAAIVANVQYRPRRKLALLAVDKYFQDDFPDIDRVQFFQEHSVLRRLYKMNGGLAPTPDEAKVFKRGDVVRNFQPDLNASRCYAADCFLAGVPMADVEDKFDAAYRNSLYSDIFPGGVYHSDFKVDPVTHISEYKTVGYKAFPKWEDCRWWDGPRRVWDKYAAGIALVKAQTAPELWVFPVWFGVK